jgi:hypothetical protein
LRDPAEQDKAKRANEILTDRDSALSVQVLQESYVQATRASRPDLITHQQAVWSHGSQLSNPVGLVSLQHQTDELSLRL